MHCLLAQSDAIGSEHISCKFNFHYRRVRKRKRERERETERDRESERDRKRERLVDGGREAAVGRSLALFEPGNTYA